MSSFLMGCYDPESRKWCTVTKCSGGYDDATLARLQKELDVIKIGKVNLMTSSVDFILPALPYQIYESCMTYVSCLSRH